MSEWITLNIVSYRIVSNTHWAEALLVSSRGDSPGGPSCPTALVAPWSEPSRIRRGSGDGCDSVAASTVSVLRWRSSVDEQPRSNRFNCSSSSVGDLLSLDIRYNINRCKRIAIYTVSTKKDKIFSMILFRTDKIYNIWRTYSRVYSGHNWSCISNESTKPA